MELEQLYQEVEEVKRIVMDTSSTQKSDHVLLLEHDKILVRGNGVPSLQENVRVLAQSFKDFVIEVREERAKRIQGEEEEKKRKKEELNKWKWALIGIVLPGVAVILGQALVFWVQLAPILSKSTP